MSLMHRTFRVSLFTKMAFGLAEIILGVVVLYVKPDDLAGILLWQQNLSNGHSRLFHLTGFMATALVTGKLVTAVYLLSHGFPKLLLGLALLRRKIWAYPIAIIILCGFILFQIFLVGYEHSIFMLGLSVIDAFIVLTVLKEFRDHKRQLKARDATTQQN